MTYLALDAVFLAVVAVVAIVAASLAARARRRGAAPRARHPRITVRAVVLAAACLVAATAVFDNVLIALRIVAYDPHAISGVFVGIAPVEDFAYTLAVVVLLPAIWVLTGLRLSGGTGRDRSPATPGPGAERRTRTGPTSESTPGPGPGTRS